MIVQIDIQPFGPVTLNIWGAVVDGEPKVFAEVQDNPLAPLVRVSTHGARNFSEAILNAAAAADRVAEDMRRGDVR